MHTCRAQSTVVSTISRKMNFLSVARRYLMKIFTSRQLHPPNHPFPLFLYLFSLKCIKLKKSLSQHHVEGTREINPFSCGMHRAERVCFELFPDEARKLRIKPRVKRVDKSPMEDKCNDNADPEEAPIRSQMEKSSCGSRFPNI